MSVDGIMVERDEIWQFSRVYPDEEVRWLTASDIDPEVEERKWKNYLLDNPGTAKLLEQIRTGAIEIGQFTTIPDVVIEPVVDTRQQLASLPPITTT